MSQVLIMVSGRPILVANRTFACVPMTEKRQLERLRAAEKQATNGQPSVGWVM